MKSSLGLRTSLALSIVAVTCWSRASHGQEPPNSGTSPATPSAPGPTPAQGEKPTASPPVATPSTPGAPAIAPPGSTPSRKWYDAVKLEGFVDVYAGFNANSPKPQSGTNLGRNFDVTNGFAVHWAGLNASYAPDPVGATVSLRFGPGGPLFNAGPDAAIGLAFVKQAFASWKPLDGVPLQIDFGKFDSWIGAEVADSQFNMTYTRSLLFTTQPFTHTGVRVDVPVSDQLDFRLYAVNGYNNSIDNNAMKTFGATVGFTPLKEVGIYANYIGGPEQSDLAPGVMGGAPTVVPGANGRWRHLADLVADFRFARGHVLVNADYGTEKLAAGTLAVDDPEKSISWFGGNLTFGYAVSDLFAFAVRGEYLSDPDGYVAPFWGAPAGHRASVVDGTLTLSVTPTPNLIIKLEPRIDRVASDQSGWEGGFPTSPDAAAPGVSKTLFTTTLGVVATTN
jgi:Putative beta-barrel porin-2, OmpL-like. bbp2